MSTWATIKFSSLESWNDQTFVSMPTNRAFASLLTHEDVAWLEISARIFEYSEAVYRAFLMQFYTRKPLETQPVQRVKTVCSDPILRTRTRCSSKSLTSMSAQTFAQFWLLWYGLGSLLDWNRHKWHKGFSRLWSPSGYQQDKHLPDMKNLMPVLNDFSNNFT